MVLLMTTAVMNLQMSKNILIHAALEFRCSVILNKFYTLLFVQHSTQQKGSCCLAFFFCICMFEPFVFFGIIFFWC